MKKKFLHLAALVAAALAFATSAHAGPRPNVVDSTSFSGGVVGVPLPVGLTPNDVKTIAGNTFTTLFPQTQTTVPPGYKEVIVPMGNRYLGQDSAGAAAAGYYYGVNYSGIQADLIGTNGPPNPPPLGSVVDGSFPWFTVNYRHVVPPQGSVVAIPMCPYDSMNGICTGPVVNFYYVIEQQGTRSTLVKVIGSTLLNLSAADINAFEVAGTRGVRAGAGDLTKICQTKGYTDFVPGSATSYAIGSGCSGNGFVTLWNGSAWTYDSACYNSLLTSAQCWK